VAVLELRLAEHSGGGWIEKRAGDDALRRKTPPKKRLSETIGVEWLPVLH